MAFTRQTYSADYYSGANIFISLGPCVLSQAYGIQYALTQEKYPIFGYNSQYYDAVAKGIVQIQGMLYLNFVSPKYLTATIHRFYQTMYAWVQALHTGSPSSLAEYLRTTPEARNLFAAMTARLDIPLRLIPLDEDEFFFPNQEVPYSYQLEVPGEDENVNIEPAFVGNPNQAPDFGILLDEFFESDAAVDGISRILWGDNVSTIDDNGIASTRLANANAIGGILQQWSLTDIASTSTAPLEMLSSLGRPDQFGDATDGINGIDITINYGNPYEKQITNATFQYDHSSSIILKGVHFTGESQAIYSNSEPIMDVYTFIAREKHTLPRKVFEY